MPLPGVVPFPPEFAQRYRDKGYWQDKSLAEEFAVCFQNTGTGFPDRRRKAVHYVELDAATDNLALNLLELGLKPLDRVVPTLPNCAEFVLLYFALQKIGAIPIAALVTHRFAEINQFVQLSGAAMCVYPERQGDFEFEPMIQRVKAGNPCLRFCVSLPQLSELIARKPELRRASCKKSVSPGSLHLPALGRNDGHPEAHPAHAQRLRLQLEDRGAGVRGDEGFGAARRAADRAQPAARLPWNPGLLLPGRQGGGLAPRARRRCLD